MSMYSRIFGENPFASILLELIALDRDQIPRFRDAHLNGDRTRVLVLTRSGGSNRRLYGTKNDALAAHPLYVADHDDDLDYTYACFEFSLPKYTHGTARGLPPECVRDEPFGEAFKEFLKRLETGDMSDPRVERALVLGKEIFASLNAGKKKIEV